MYSVLAGISGVACGGLVVSLAETIGHKIFPFGDMEEAKKGKAPTGAKAAVVVAWFVGGITASAVGSLISGGEERPAMVATAILCLASFANLKQIPSPWWMWLTGLGCYYPAYFIESIFVNVRSALLSSTGGTILWDPQDASSLVTDDKSKLQCKRVGNNLPCSPLIFEFGPVLPGGDPEYILNTKILNIEIRFLIDYSGGANDLVARCRNLQLSLNANNANAMGVGINVCEGEDQMGGLNAVLPRSKQDHLVCCESPPALTALQPGDVVPDEATSRDTAWGPSLTNQVKLTAANSTGFGITSQFTDLEDTKKVDIFWSTMLIHFARELVVESANQQSLQSTLLSVELLGSGLDVQKYYSGGGVEELGQCKFETLDGTLVAILEVNSVSSTLVECKALNLDFSLFSEDVVAEMTAGRALNAFFSHNQGALWSEPGVSFALPASLFPTESPTGLALPPTPFLQLPPSAPTASSSSGSSGSLVSGSFSSFTGDSFGDMTTLDAVSASAYALLNGGEEPPAFLVPVVIGVVSGLLLAILAVIIVCIMRRRSSSAGSNATAMSSSSSSSPASLEKRHSSAATAASPSTSSTRLQRQKSISDSGKRKKSSKRHSSRHSAAPTAPPPAPIPGIGGEYQQISTVQPLQYEVLPSDDLQGDSASSDDDLYHSLPIDAQNRRVAGAPVPVSVNAQGVIYTALDENFGPPPSQFDTLVQN